MSRFLFDEVSLDEIYLGDNKTTCDDLNPARSCLGTLRLRLRAKKRRGHASQSKLANSVSRKKKYCHFGVISKPKKKHLTLKHTPTHASPRHDVKICKISHRRFECSSPLSPYSETFARQFLLLPGLNKISLACFK